MYASLLERWIWAIIRSLTVGMYFETPLAGQLGGGEGKAYASAVVFYKHGVFARVRNYCAGYCSFECGWWDVTQSRPHLEGFVSGSGNQTGGNGIAW